MARAEGRVARCEAIAHILSMTNWTNRYSYRTPRQGFITVRLPDGSETQVEWNPLKQSWDDREGKTVSNWTEWKDG